MLTNTFTDKELELLKECFKWHQIEAAFLTKEVFVAILENIDTPADLTGADMDGIIAKVNHLDPGQLFILNEEIYRYWNGQTQDFLQG